MPNKSLSYPKVCRRTDGKYYIDFNLNGKRFRLFNGKYIGSSNNPNSYPPRLRKTQSANLAKEVYYYLISNNHSFTKRPKNKLEFFDYLIERKLSWVPTCKMVPFFFIISLKTRPWFAALGVYGQGAALLGDIGPIIGWPILLGLSLIISNYWAFL